MYVQDVAASASGELQIPAGFQVNIAPLTYGSLEPIALYADSNTSKSFLYEPGRTVALPPWKTLTAKGLEPTSTWRVQLANETGDDLGIGTQRLPGAILRADYALTGTGENMFTGTYALTTRGLLTGADAWAYPKTVRRPGRVELKFYHYGYSSAGTPTVTLKLNLLDTPTALLNSADRVLALPLSATPTDPNGEVISISTGGPSEVSTSTVLQITQRWTYVSASLLVEDTSATKIQWDYGMRIELWEYPA